MKLLDITTFLGRLHPLIVHLPIGFLLLAMFFDLLSYNRKYAQLRSAVSMSLLAGFIAAVLACILGYILSFTGGYNFRTLDSHETAGIVTTIVAGILFLFTTQKVKRFIAVPAKIFSTLFIGLIVLVSYTGHIGGSLTHGADYISLRTLTQQKREKPSSAEQAMIFEDVVQPILEKKCGQCHQQGKLKGQLSIETLDDLLKGGKHGPAITPGKTGESELYKRITLDPSDEAFMPSDGKTPLTKNETALIKWWIEKGDAAAGKKLADYKNVDELRRQIIMFLGLQADAPGGDTAGTIVQKINPEIPQTADMRRIENLRNKGCMVRLLLKKPVMLDITLPAGSGVKMASINDDLKAIAPNIVWLNLSGNGFADNDLEILKQLNNLERLRLEKNPVTDGIGNYLSSLKNLESVNLNETQITKAGIEQLKKNPALKRIYTWKTAADTTRPNPAPVKPAQVK